LTRLNAQRFQIERGLPSAVIGEINGHEIKMTALSLCIKDDSRDCDVPLAELSSSFFGTPPKFYRYKWRSKVILSNSGEYYDRSESIQITGQLLFSASIGNYDSLSRALQVAITSHYMSQTAIILLQHFSGCTQPIE